MSSNTSLNILPITTHDIEKGDINKFNITKCVSFIKFEWNNSKKNIIKNMVISFIIILAAGIIFFKFIHNYYIKSWNNYQSLRKNKFTFDIEECILFVIYEFNNIKKCIALFLLTIAIFYVEYNILLKFPLKFKKINGISDALSDCFGLNLRIMMLSMIIFGIYIMLYEPFKYISKYYIESWNNHNSKH